MELQTSRDQIFSPIRTQLCALFLTNSKFLFFLALQDCAGCDTHIIIIRHVRHLCSYSTKIIFFLLLASIVSTSAHSIVHRVTSRLLAISIIKNMHASLGYASMLAQRTKCRASGEFFLDFTAASRNLLRYLKNFLSANFKILTWFDATANCRMLRSISAIKLSYVTQ